MSRNGRGITRLPAIAPSHFSSGRRWESQKPQDWVRRVLGMRTQRKDSKLKPNDLPPLPESANEIPGTTLGRSKVANELKLKCTEFDESGNVTLVHGEF